MSPAEREATTAEQWRQQLLELFAPDRGPARRLIAAGRLELAADNTHDLPRVPVWRNGSMVIIGDAAHAPSPTSGQGASMAAEDGVVLARCLRDLPDVPRALEVYERLRRRRVERIVAQGARTGSAKTPGPSAACCATCCCRWCSASWSPTAPWPGSTTTTSTGMPPPPRRGRADPPPAAARRGCGAVGAEGSAEPAWADQAGLVGQHHHLGAVAGAQLHHRAGSRGSWRSRG